MNPIRIAHISDPHFAKGKNRSVWENVCSYMQKEVKPELILVTGDITDNATEEEFDYALDMLKQLLTYCQLAHDKLLIIPGNHDRYPYSGISWVNFWSFKSNKRKFKAALFEKTFPSSYFPTATHPADKRIKSLGGTTWDIRIIGIDSNHPNSWFAQGGVEETTASHVKEAALAKTNTDLVIVLVHHHILPVPEVERRTFKKGLLNVADVTGLINSGVLIEYLSDGQVNLALHGHEHARHNARVSGSGPLSGPTVIVGAGSVTGSEGRAWSIDKVHFNVLELFDDKSVRLAQVRHEATALSWEKSSRKILSGAAIRRARFVRRNKKLQNLPECKLKKLVAIGEDRSATMVVSRNNVVTPEHLVHVTSNSTGHIEEDAVVTLDLADGRSISKDLPFEIDDDPTKYRCHLELEKDFKQLARITIAWKWEGALLLQKSDANTYPSEALDGHRTNNREFVALCVSPEDELEEATLVVTFPPDSAPAPQSFRVDWEDAEGRRGTSTELTKSLSFCGPEHVELRVPYPDPDNKFFLSWELTDDKQEEEEVLDSLRELLENNYQNVYCAARKEIVASLLEKDVSVALYTVDQDNKLNLLRRSGDDSSPRLLSMSDPRSKIRTALLGMQQIVSKDNGSEPEVGPEEIWAMYTPIEPRFERSRSRGAGLLRVALMRAAVERGLDEDRVSELLMSRALWAAVEMGRLVEPTALSGEQL